MENNNKKNTFLEKLHYFSTLALVFSFPFSMHIVKVIIFLWLLTWLIQIKKSDFKITTNKLYLFTIVFFYILHLISYFYSENSEQFFKVIFKLIYFLIFPFVILLKKDLYKRNFKNILSFFVLGNITVSLICVINAFYNSLIFSNSSVIFNASIKQELGFFQSISNTGNYFFYDHFSIFLHPSYFAMSVVFSIIILLYFKINKNNEDKNKLLKILTNKYILLFILSFLIIIVFLLSSKINVFAVFIVIIFIFFTFKIKYKNIIFLLIISISTIFVSSNPRFLGFLINTTQIADKEEHEIKSATSRLYIWESAFDIASKNLIFGVGAGDVIDALVENFTIKKYDKLVEKKYNVHNDFLETFVKLGIIGLFVFISIFIIVLKDSIKQKKYLTVLFLLLIISNFLVESMLDRIMGVYFFSFFINFLHLTDYKNIIIKKNIINFNLFFKFKNIITFLIAIIIILSIINIKIITKKEEIKKVSEKNSHLDNPVVRIFTSKLYNLIDNKNLWNQKMYWQLPENDKNTAIPFKLKNIEQGSYRLYSIIKYYKNDSSVNSRITIKANYTDNSFDLKSNYSVIKNDEWIYYEINIKTDTLKELESISGWILDHSKTNGQKHVTVKYIGLIKND